MNHIVLMQLLYDIEEPTEDCRGTPRIEGAGFEKICQRFSPRNFAGDHIGCLIGDEPIPYGNKAGYMHSGLQLGFLEKTASQRQSVGSHIHGPAFGSHGSGREELLDDDPVVASSIERQVDVRKPALTEKAGDLVTPLEAGTGG
jgi:hypothetical protein